MAPSILAIVLFIISFFAIIIPQFEKNMMDRKKEMIRELTNTAWSILKEHHLEYMNGELTLEEAQKVAANQIEQMRYGVDRKDYFWIIDYSPKMIMHPYLQELNNTNLEDFKDSHEKKLFVDAVKLVKEDEEGFIDYYWQWKDDNTRVVPKLSFVKGFEQWEWLIGTGIYLEDVEQEIASLKSRLLKISSIIIGIIIIALIYIIRQSLNIENKRKAAEQKLIQSKQKYKTLVDASTEGTLMFVNNRVVFNNLKFAKMIDCPSTELNGASFNELFTIKWDKVLTLLSNPKKSISTETQLICDGNKGRNIVISVSRIIYSNQEAFIVVAKDVSRKVQLEKSAQQLSQELQTSLLLMNQPIKSFVKPVLTCDINTAIHEVAALMTLKNQKVIFIKQEQNIIGVINDTDLKKRVLAKDLDTKSKAIEIMSAPIRQISENALLYEAVLLFRQEGVSHLLVINTQNDVVGVIGSQEALEVQRNSLSYLIQEIEKSQHIEELKQIYNHVPVLINAIIVNSDNAQNITRIITSVADAISVRVINLAIEQHGPPPCSFAFMALGSEGRMEQTLKTDQDNAIVLSDEASEDDLEYFRLLATTINKDLHTIGYNYCIGDVMARNEKWCQTLKVWKNYFSTWTQSPDPQNVLDSSIFFDFRCIYGENSLVDDLQEHVHEKVKDNGLFFYHISNSIIKYKVSADTDAFNFKKVLLPLIGYVRIYTLYHQLAASNTIERIEILSEKQVFSQEHKNELIQIYNYLMHHRLKFQTHALLNNEAPENTIDFKHLSHIEQNTLKKSHKEISELQTQLGLTFKNMT